MIVLGCQRSGTKTAAKIFGLQHEVIFNPSSTFKTAAKATALVSEASWMATPFIQILRAKTPIIHLVRNPLAVINSLVNVHFFEDAALENEHAPYRRFYDNNLGGSHIKLTTPVEKAMHCWVAWNKKIQNVPRIKIEDIANSPVLNTGIERGAATEALGWVDLPEGPLYQDVYKLSYEYGYE